MIECVATEPMPLNNCRAIQSPMTMSAGTWITREPCRTRTLPFGNIKM